VRLETGVDAKTCDERAAPFEAKLHTPWLRRGEWLGKEELVGKVINGGNASRRATPQEIETGRFFKDIELTPTRLSSSQKPKDGKETRHKSKSKTVNYANGRTAMKGIEMVVLSDDDMAMIRAAAQGLDGPGVEQFINDVRSELNALATQGVTPTKNHVRAVCTKVLARGK
jgi:hypothetical protein